MMISAILISIFLASTTLIFPQTAFSPRHLILSAQTRTTITHPSCMLSEKNAFRQSSTIQYAPSTPTPPITENIQPTTNNRQQTTILALVNAQRVSEGKQSLATSSDISSMAQNLAQNLSEASLCGHTDSNGQDMITRAKNHAISYSAIGETIACGQQSQQQAVEGWWNSPGHKDILLDPKYSHIGIGIVGTTYVAVLKN